MLTFNEFLKKKRGNKWLNAYNDKTFVGIDPGATTGVCSLIITEDDIIIKKGQLDTGKGENYKNQVNVMFNYLDEVNPDFIICEDYRIYEDKSDMHISIKLYTPELIGMIKTWAVLNNCEVIMQPAIVIKRGFVKDDKMKTWGYGKVSGGHAKNHWHDALKHLFYALLFNKDI